MERKVIFVGGRRHGQMETIEDYSISEEAKMDGYITHALFFEDKGTRYYMAYLKGFHENAVEAMMKNFLPHYFVPSPSYEYFPEDIYTKKVAAFSKAQAEALGHIRQENIDNSVETVYDYGLGNTGPLEFNKINVVPTNRILSANYTMEMAEPIVFFDSDLPEWVEDLLKDEIEETFENEVPSGLNMGQFYKKSTKSAWDTQLEKELKNGDDTWGKIAKKYK